MSATRVYGPIGESDVATIVRLYHHAFASTPDAEQKWIRPAGLENFRGVRESEKQHPCACLLRIPMGQYFGGRRVSILGIAGVATAPEARGQGLGKWMMGRAMAE